MSKDAYVFLGVLALIIYFALVAPTSLVEIFFLAGMGLFLGAYVTRWYYGTFVIPKIEFKFLRDKHDLVFYKENE